jgi:hypothetical protein
MRTKRPGANGNRGKTTQGEQEKGRNDPGRTGIGAKRLKGRTGLDWIGKPNNFKVTGSNET